VSSPAPSTAPRFKTVAFSGSLRAGSSNLGLLKLAARIADEIAPGELVIEWAQWIDQLPWYDPDLENDLPEIVVRWRATIAAADAILIGLPEYNFGPSALAKNAIDWLSRPVGSHVLNGKVIALFTSAGKGGGTNVQQALAPILGWFGNTVVTEPATAIAKGATKIDGEGNTDDDELAAAVRTKTENVLAALRNR
jgi:chromate reductase